MTTGKDSPAETVMRRRSQVEKPVVEEPSDSSLPVKKTKVFVYTPPKAWVPSLFVQKITFWILLAVSCFFVVAVVVEELQASWYRSPVFESLSSHLRGAENLDRILGPGLTTGREPITIELSWNVTKGIRSPDGVKKVVYLINDEFLGPTIEAQSGDKISLKLFNAIQDEGLAIHFHGMEMRGYNNMDGAVGLTQDPIPSGGNMSYCFQISDDQVGTFFYHAHSQVQRADGVFGAFIIRKSESATREEGGDRWDVAHEERIIMINDWYHRSADDALHWYMRSGSFGMEPVPDSILINGVGAFNCSNAVPARPLQCVSKMGASLPNMRFEANKLYRLRFINTGMLAGVSISIPGTIMTIIEVDGGEGVELRKATTIATIYPGQRVDVLIRWPSAGNDEIQIALDEDAFRYPNPALTSVQFFPIKVSGFLSSTQSAPRPRHVDLLSLLPVVAHEMPNKADRTIVLYTTTLKLARLSNVPHGFMNHTTWSPQSPPLLLLSRSDYNKDQLIPFIPLTDPPLWIDIVLNNLDEDDHPFHLHGHAPFVLQTHSEGWGFGSWNPYTSEVPPGGEIDLSRAVKRDTFMVPRRGYVVLRFKADNPGIWMFHVSCNLFVCKDYVYSNIRSGLRTDRRSHFFPSKAPQTNMKSL